jgi:hypothetical protein
MIAKEMGLPWRAVEAMHWQMGCEDMASRANVSVFQPHMTASTKPQSHIPSKRKVSGSPPTGLSDSSVGGGDIGTGSGNDFPRSESVDQSSLYPRRRSSSMGSKHAGHQESPKDYTQPNIQAHHSAIDEHRHSRARHDSGGGHLHERIWRQREEREEREDTGTSHHSHRRRSGSVSSGGRSSHSGEIPREPIQVRDG